VPGADDQPDVSLSPEDEDLLARYGADAAPQGLSLVDEDADAGVTPDQTAQDARPGQAQAPEPQQGQPTEHPDNLPFLDQDDAQAAAELRRRLDENPMELIERLRGGTLRLRDYTQKNQARAEREREMELREQELEQAQRELEQLRQQRQQLQQQRQQQPPQAQTLQEFVQQFEAEHGRQPTQAEWIDHQIETRVQSRLDQAVEERVQERTSELEERIMAPEMEMIEQRATQQYEALCEEFPRAGRPEEREQLIEFLSRQDTRLTKGNEMRRAYLYLHPEVLDEARNAALETRQQQVERRQTDATPPPGPAAGETTRENPKTTNLDELAEQIKGDPTIQQRLSDWWQSRFQ